MRQIMCGVSGVLLACGAASATTFSFASDSQGSGFTWRGSGATVRQATDPGVPLALLIDDDNGPLPALSMAVEFRANFVIAHTTSVNLGGGRFLHTYAISGTPEGSAVFGFYLPSGAPLLTATVAGGSLSALGTQSRWGTSAGLQATDIAGQVTYTWHGADNAPYGLYSGQNSVGLDDAAFSLTALFAQSGAGAALGSDNLPSEAWQSEGSFSGTAHFVPAPGALALLGVGVLAAGRRKR